MTVELGIYTFAELTPDGRFALVNDALCRLLGEKLATNQDLQNAERQLESNRAVLAALGVKS